MLSSWMRVSLVVALAIAGASGAFADPVSLVYRPQVGEVVELTTTGVGELELAILDEPIRANAEVKSVRKVTAIDDQGVCTMESTVTDGFVKANQIRVDLVNLGKTAVIRVAPDRRVIAVDKPVKPDPDAVGLDISSLLIRATGGLVFPERPIEIGEYWTRDIQVFGADGEAIALDIRHQLVAVEDHEGTAIARIESKVKIPTTMTILQRELKGTIYIDGRSEVELKTGEVLKQVVDCRAVFKGTQGVEAFEATIKQLHIESIVTQRKIEPVQAVAAHAVALTFRPTEKRVYVYRVSTTGRVDVTALGENQELEGEVEVELEVVPSADGVLVRYANSDSQIRVGEATMKVPESASNAALFDAQHRIMKVLSDQTGTLPETNPVALFVSVLGAVAWPERTVEVGESWDVNYMTEDVQGLKHKVESRHTLSAVRRDGDSLIASILSDVTFPVVIRYKGFHLNGTAVARVESDVRTADGLPIRQRVSQVNCTLRPVDETQKLELALHDVRAVFELVAEHGQA